jgi:hypothetical protein
MSISFFTVYSIYYLNLSAIFNLVIKKRARVPAGDSFVVRRIAGPGLASNYFYQVRGKRSNCSRIRLIDGSENFFVLKTTCKKDFAEAVYLFEFSSPPRFLSRSGQAIL